MAVVNALNARFVIDEKAFERYALRVADEGVDEARELLSEKSFPPASAPGTPPARRSGNLAESFTAEQVDGGAEVSTTVAYARFLEDGTKHMAARPFIEEVVERTARAARRLPMPRLVRVKPSA